MMLRLAVFAVVIAVYLPVLLWMIQEWLNNPSYGHGFLVPIVSAFSFWLRRGRLVSDKPTLPAIIIIVAGLLAYVLSYSIWGLYFVAALSLPVVIFGMVAYMSGTKRAREFLFPIVFLVFMIPLPIVDQLGYHMQNFATDSSTAVARLLGVNVLSAGNQISLVGSSFTVGAQCSGMNSLISLLAIAVL